MKCVLLAKDPTSPETYAREQKGLHVEVKAHRDDRIVRVGPQAVLVLEDEHTVRYRVQEAETVRDA